MSDPIGAFSIAKYHFTCYLPDGPDDEQVWTIVVTESDMHGNQQEVRREKIPLAYEPRFGPDVGDVMARDQRVEEIIKELGLE